MKKAKADAPVLEITGLTKRYNDRPVLDNLTLKLPSAALVGLLGPNGAGKTTLIKALAGLIAVDKGQIKLATYDLREQEAQARSQMSHVPDTPSFYPELTVLEHLELMARAHKALDGYQEQAEKLLRRFGLWEARHGLPFTLSRGMSQKLALCCALIRPSKILLLDEPGGTLDIRSLSNLYRTLAEYRDGGGLAIVSSHQWETMQNLCDMFVLLDQGQLLAAGDLPFLRESADLPPDASLREVYLAFTETEAVSISMTDDTEQPSNEETVL